MPRFAILEHDHPHRHWDLLLEAGPVLRSWRLSAPPGAAEDPAAEPTPDHRPLYLDYGGPVGGGRGSVVRWDGGSFEWLEDGPDRVRVRLRGGRLKGLLVIEGGRATWRAEG
jgi:hypothetical protein